MHEAHGRIHCNEMLESERRLRGAVHCGLDEGEIIVDFEVAEVERSFLTAGEDGNNASIRREADEGQEIVGEAETGVVP
jgi:hypothetical protein